LELGPGAPDGEALVVLERQRLPLRHLELDLETQRVEVPATRPGQVAHRKPEVIEPQHDCTSERRAILGERPAQAGPKPMAVWLSRMMGRKRTGRPTASRSSGMSTIRPRIDTPSLSLTAATAHGASAMKARGAARLAGARALV